MGLTDDFFERFGRRKRKRTPEQTKLLREILAEAYNLVYYILGDTKDTKLLAQRALAGLMQDFDRIKHRPVNQRTYSREKDPGIRRVSLPMDLELAARVFALTSSYQRRRAHRATVEDLDVWFCKCVLLQSLRHKNAFGALYGISNGIHVYGEIDSTVLFYTLAETVPRNKEAWKVGNEPLDRNRKSLAWAIDDEFGGLIKRDHKGNLIRRSLHEQPVKFIAECLVDLINLKASDTCLNKLTSNHSRDDVESELARLHITLHWPCYNLLVAEAGLEETKNKIGMPEYTIMLKTNGNKSRRAPALGDDELDTMFNHFQLMIEERRRASSCIIVTVNGEQLQSPSVQLTEEGKTQLQLNEGAKLVEIWARDNDRPDVLLSAFFLSMDDDRQVFTLEAGQQITFSVNYFEADDDEGRFEVNIGYRETKLTRRFQQLISIWHPLLNFSMPSVRSAALASMATITAFAVLLPLVYWLSGLNSIPAFWNHQSLVKQDSHPTGNQNVVYTGGRDSGSAPAKESPDPNPNHPLSASSKPGATADDPAPSKRQSTKRSGSRAAKDGSLTEVPSLATIDRIYVESTGVYDNSEVNRHIDSLQMSAIEKSRIFELKDNPDEAQARLVIVSDFEGTTGDKAQAQLITAKDGKVIWYGPLVGIARDSDTKTAMTEVRHLVQVIMDALVRKKEEVLQFEKAPNKSKRTANNHALRDS
jgi:hypothetical protein